MSGKFYLLKPGWLGFLLCIALLTTGCGMDVVPLLPETTVANLPGEDLAGPCTYALRLTPGPVVVQGQAPTSIPQTGVLVVFERLDSLTLFDDPTVIAAAQKLHLAMMYAYECDAASFDDLQPMATSGPGRALFQALNQFAVSLQHPELANANVFLTGFSAAGFLTLTTANAYPSRVLGTVAYAPASGYFDISGVKASPGAAKIPSLILVSANDIAAGDQRPFVYFLNGWAQGAPWGFASQQGVNHCCVDSIAPMLNQWMTSIFTEYTSAAPGGLVSFTAQLNPAPATVAFEISSDGSFDPFGYQNFYLGSYSILPSTSGGPYRAWLPDQATTQAWVTWITNLDGN